MKVVAGMTGLTPATIRAWERRYGAISPARSETSRRLYTHEEVERLRRLRELVETGHAIGRIARLSEDELRSLGRVRRVAQPPAGGATERILKAVERYDYAAADRECYRVAMMLPPRRIAYEFAQPLIAEVGQRWTDGRFTMGQEHMVTAMLRTLLGALMRLAEPQPRARSLVLATPSGERHELGLLLVGLIAASQGLPVCYLGVDLPGDEIALAAHKTQAGIVGLSLAYVANAARSTELVRQLASALSPATGLWLGGAGVARLEPDGWPANVRCFSTLEDLEDALAQGFG